MTARPSLLQRAAVALVDDVARIAERLLLGLRCDVCGEHARGWRTLLIHAEREHPGEVARDA